MNEMKKSIKNHTFSLICGEKSRFFHSSLFHFFSFSSFLLLESIFIHSISTSSSPKTVYLHSQLLASNNLFIVGFRKMFERLGLGFMNLMKGQVYEEAICNLVGLLHSFLSIILWSPSFSWEWKALERLLWRESHSRPREETASTTRVQEAEQKESTHNMVFVIRIVFSLENECWAVCYSCSL